MAFDPQAQRRIMGCFATGVTVVTTRTAGQAFGMTANAVMSLSLEPPLVVVAVNRQAQMHGALISSRFFAISILSAEQEDLSRRFATPGPKDFSDLALIAARTEAPILAQALAYVDCKLVETLSGGDHDLFVGEILAGDVRDPLAAPLLYFKGRYGRLAE